MRKRTLALLALCATLLLALNGCGSNRSSDGVADTGGSDSTLANAQTQGIDNCTTCHESYPQTQAWLASTAHGNSNGTPDITFFGKTAEDAAVCAACHNPLGDGDIVVDAFRLTAETNRPVVGCESCHGGGQFHNGIAGGIPFNKPDYERCASCHEGKHGMTIATDFTDTPHLSSINEHVWADEAQTEARARCSKCHTDEGARKYRLLVGDHDELVTALENEANIANPSPIQCRTCHTPHQEEVPLLGTDEAFTGSNQFNTCTNCHTLYDTIATAGAGAEDLTDHYHDPAVNGYGAFNEIITDTHYDDPATTDVIEGYIVNKNATSSCSDCHNLHSADNTINNQWARSGHAGRILSVKEETEQAQRDAFVDPTAPTEAERIAMSAAVKAAGVTVATGPAWSYYDFATKYGGACIRCHTSTGAANYLDNPTAPAASDFSYKDPNQREMLSCTGCHSDSQTGDLRASGAVADIGYTVGGAVVALPDLGQSNTCAPCHTGRGNMDSLGLITAPADPAQAAPATTTTKTHYLNATATLYADQTRPGYEYAGQDYANKPYFAHSGIGLNADAPETGDGPCVSCHMGGSEDHTFEVATKDSNGVFTAINNQDLCNSCHSTYPMNATILEEEAEGYHEALEILEAALAAKGSVFEPAYPYFFVDQNGDGILDVNDEGDFDANVTTPDSYDSAVAWEDEGHLGAAHNFNYLHHEPGAYAHNRYYTKRLIFDALDWLDDGALDGTITIDAVTYPEADAWLGAGTARP